MVGNTVLNGEKLQALYNIYDVMHLLNDSPNTQLNPWDEGKFTLKRGQTILVPALRGQKSINGEPCTPVGKLVFDRTYNRDARQWIKKLLRYGNRVKEVK
jgi:hypothetical protein